MAAIVNMVVVGVVVVCVCVGVGVVVVIVSSTSLLTRPDLHEKSEAALSELQGVAFSLAMTASMRFLSSLFVLPVVLVDASLDRLHTSGAELSQASEPITVQVNYDGKVATPGHTHTIIVKLFGRVLVPTFGEIAESSMLRQATAREAKMAQR